MEENIKGNGLQAFLKGLTRFARYPQILFSAYVFNLLSALLLMLIPAFLLLKPAQYSAIQTAADGIDTWLVTEMMMSTTTYPALQGLSETLSPDWLNQSILVIVATLFVIPLLSWLPSSFLAGGILLTYVESPQEFSWQRFLWGCWHWFGAFLLINMLLGIITQALVIILLIGIGFAFSIVGSWVNWITIPIFVFITAAWLAILEYTRLLAVSGNTLNTIRSLWKAIGLVFRRPLTLMGLYALSLLTLLLTHLIFRPLLLTEFVSWWPLYLIVSQIFIVARLSTRLVRWAGIVTISDPHNRWSAVVMNFDPNKVSDSISWNRRFADGTLAPSGEYPVVAMACDIHDLCGRDTGIIVVPTTATSTATMTDSPTATITQTPYATSTATQRTPTPTPVLVTPSAERPSEPVHPPLPIWQLIGLLALFMVIASASVVDPRPAALDRLRETFKMKSARPENNSHKNKQD